MWTANPVLILWPIMGLFHFCDISQIFQDLVKDRLKMGLECVFDVQDIFPIGFPIGIANTAKILPIGLR